MYLKIPSSLRGANCLPYIFKSMMRKRDFITTIIRKLKELFLNNSEEVCFQGEVEKKNVVMKCIILKKKKIK